MDIVHLFVMVFMVSSASVSTVVFADERLDTSSPQYMGCYGDNRVRAMSFPPRTNGRPRTIDGCVDLCRSQNFTIAGAHYGYECFCGSNITYRKYNNTIKCYNAKLSRCTDSTDTVCGGPYAISVYRVCPVGFFGPDCLDECPENCGGRGCEMTGECSLDCPAGVMGENCSQVCPDGKFGPSCMYDCGTFCNNCEGKLGMCRDGCSGGKKGPFCLNSCKTSYRVTGNCPFCAHCKDHKCVGTTDSLGCYHKCPTTWMGTLCIACSNGKWGNRCEGSCHENCLNSSCNFSNSECDLGCVDGYHGGTCNISCSTNCRDKICAQTDGTCAPCHAGFYGEQCTLECGHCLGGRCRQNDSACISCEDGYFGLVCKQPCQNCNGSCQQSDECTPGYFGPDCRFPCRCALNSSCDVMTGSCPDGEGCQGGWTGANCSIVYSYDALAVGGGTSPLVLGLVFGVIGALLAISVLFVIIVLRRRRDKKQTSCSHWCVKKRTGRDVVVNDTTVQSERNIRNLNTASDLYYNIALSTMDDHTYEEPVFGRECSKEGIYEKINGIDKEGHQLSVQQLGTE